MANEEVREKNIEYAMLVAYQQCLIHGIDATTKMMVAEASGLSRPSIDRYFPSKVDLVVQTAAYIGNYIHNTVGYPEIYFTDGKHTGVGLLKIFMMRARDLYIDDSRIFVLRNEFKQFVYRNCESFNTGYAWLLNQLGYRDTTRRIFEVGITDKSFDQKLDPEYEAEFFSESYFGFLGNLAFMDGIPPEKHIEQIERYIDRVLKFYKYEA